MRLKTHAAIAIAVLSVLASGPARAAGEFAFFHENVMGTSLELRVNATSRQAAVAAESRVLGEIDRLARIFSGYDAASEFSRWQAVPAPGIPTPVSPELFALLQASDDWHARSHGAFDPRVESLSRLWAACAKANRVPTADEHAAALARMRPPAWRLDRAGHTAQRLTDCPISLNAIAKGYIVEQACSAAMSAQGEVLGVLLNVGGDLRVCGTMRQTIGIANPFHDSDSSAPFARIAVSNRAVATSGSTQRGFRINGKHYSHVFDPRTGLPASTIVSATVIAERSADADALATICNVLEPEESLRLAATLPGVDCLIIAADGRVARSAGWPRYEVKAETIAAVALAATPKAADDDVTGKAGSPGVTNPTPAASSFWGDSFELAVSFVINRPDDGERRYRRPYVVVWVEDSAGHQVRTVALWLSTGGAAPYPWLPDLKRWYRTEQARPREDKTDLPGTISRPTRPPGKYTVIWDGKDNNGKPVAGGAYTINIEAAREHGTYQSIRKRVSIADKPFAEELTGNVEIKSAALEYRRKDPAR